MTEINVRGRIRELVKIRIDGADEFSLPTMTNSILALLRQDEDFMREFVAATLREEIYTIVAQAVGQSRKLMLVGDEALTPGAVARRADKFADRFLGWYEHSGDRHVQLMEMTREDLFASASERRQRGNRELRIAALWTQLANGLTDGQTVKERFTAEAIERLYTNIERAEEGAAA